MSCKFFEMLEARWNKGARVCVGLDSAVARLPQHFRATGSVFNFNIEIVQATKDLALAYKPNIAFYSGNGVAFLEQLKQTVSAIRNVAPHIPIILDSKRADIGNTNAGYVAEAFDDFDADAVTVNPYFGMEAMKPFLDQKDKGIIVLCRTSNKGAGEFQDVTLVATDPPNRSMQLYEYVANRVANHWNYNGNCALVVGATYPEELWRVREIVGDMWLLVPGIGAQGGDVEKVLQHGLNSRRNGLIINSSSGIIFKSSGPDFARAARLELKRLTGEIDASLATPA